MVKDFCRRTKGRKDLYHNAASVRLSTSGSQRSALSLLSYVKPPTWTSRERGYFSTPVNRNLNQHSIAETW